jgi:hypothetical protein
MTQITRTALFNVCTQHKDLVDFLTGCDSFEKEMRHLKHKVLQKKMRKLMCKVPFPVDVEKNFRVRCLSTYPRKILSVLYTRGNSVT